MQTVRHIAPNSASENCLACPDFVARMSVDLSLRALSIAVVDMLDPDHRGPTELALIVENVGSRSNRSSSAGSRQRRPRRRPSYTEGSTHLGCCRRLKDWCCMGCS